MPATRSSARRASGQTEHITESLREGSRDVTEPATGDAPVDDMEVEEEEEDNEETAAERAEREKAVWDSIVDQHFEVIDQLPLTLRRQFALLRELDEQAHGYSDALQRTIREYITKRAAIKQSASSSTSQLPDLFTNVRADGISTPVQSEPPLKTPESPHPSHHKPISNLTPIPLRLTTALNEERAPLRRTLSDFAPQTPTTPIAIPLERQKPPETTREMLSHMGWLMDEWMKTCNEKVSLAQSAHDSVGRQIRLVEQAIREQEASLALGAREGAPVVVSEVAVPPRWQRDHGRATLSPILDDVDAPPEDHMGVDTEKPLLAVTPQTKKKARKSRKSQVQGAARKPVLRLKPLLPQEPADDSYCYCHRPDDGTEMIECSGSQIGLNCLSNEWVHFRCMTPAEAAEAKAKEKSGDVWYCRSCQRAVEQS